MKIALVVDRMPSGQSLERLVRELAGPGMVDVYLTEGYKYPSPWLAEHPADVIVAGGGRESPGWIADRPDEARRTVVVATDPTDALRAFDWGVADFVVLPVRLPRLARALARGCGAERQASPPSLAVRKVGRVELVPVEKLVYAQAADKYVEIVLCNGKRELLDGTLAHLAQTLPSGFARVHKSYLVRLSLVKGIRARRGSHYALELNTGAHLPVGRTFYKAVRERLLGRGQSPQ